VFNKTNLFSLHSVAQTNCQLKRESMVSLSSILRLWAVTITLLLFQAPIGVVALPAGFEDEEVVQMTGAVDIAFVGNRLLAITDKGDLYTADLEDFSDFPHDKELALSLRDRICENGERG
jgi:hypothetical protein